MSQNENQSETHHAMDVWIPLGGSLLDGSEAWNDRGGELYKTVTLDPNLNWELALCSYRIVGTSTEDLSGFNDFKMLVDVDLMNTEGEKQTLHFSTIMRPCQGFFMSDFIFEYTEKAEIFKIDAYRVRSRALGVTLPATFPPDFLISTSLMARYEKCQSCYVCKPPDYQFIV